MAANPEAIPRDEITVEDVLSRWVTLRTGAPVLYYRPQRRSDDAGVVHLEPHPLTRKRFETLWNRLKRELPWLEEMQGRPHDLRKTPPTTSERPSAPSSSGPSATPWLYTMAGPEAIEEAHRWLVGEARRRRAER